MALGAPGLGYSVERFGLNQSEENPVPEAKSGESMADDVTEETAAELEPAAGDDAAATPAATTTSAASGIDPKRAEKERLRQLKTDQKAEAAARRADMKKYAAAQKEGDKVLKTADVAQAKADKASAVADAADEKAVAAEDAMATDATDQAKARATKAREAADKALQAAAELQAEAKKAQKAAQKVRSARKLTGHEKPQAPGSRQWVPPTFITVGLVGVIWLVVYYLTASVGIQIPYMTDLGGWNVMVGMGLMAASFGIATLWK